MAEMGEMVVRLDASGLAEVMDNALDLGLDGDGRWFRSGVARGIEATSDAPAVDREQGIIRGFSVITKGPALGHDMDIDDITLSQVEKLGNAAKQGVKSRFDHPNASNTSMGTFIGRAKQFRRSGDRVLADLHLSEAAKEAPQGDLYSYVLSLAEKDPAAFGASIVFTGKAEPRLNADGTRQKDEQGNPLPKLARVESLLAADVVDDPAANPNGLFHREESLAAKITAFLNRWAAHDLLPALQAAAAITKEDRTMGDQSAVDAAREEGRKLGQADGVKAERERVRSIQKAFASVWGEQPPATEIKVRDGHIELGSSVEDAETAFKQRKLNQLTEAAPKSAGGGDASQSTETDLSSLTLDERCKVEWDKNHQGVREEFGTLATYTAFKKADAGGHVKILKK